KCPSPGCPNCGSRCCNDDQSCCNGEACCDSGQVCCGEKCCPLGQTCDKHGKCKNPFEECTPATCDTFIPCSSTNSDCVCGSIADGGGFCVPGSTPCAGLPTCSTNADCSKGSICLVDTCCGPGVCVS